MERRGRLNHLLLQQTTRFVLGQQSVPVLKVVFSPFLLAVALLVELSLSGTLVLLVVGVCSSVAAADDVFVGSVIPLPHSANSIVSLTDVL